MVENSTKGKKVMEASMAVAEAVKSCNPSVIAMYPITPQTHIVEHIADFVNDGDMQAELIDVESEHSAMASCIGAQATGVRTFTATSSQGMALMHEMVFIASGMRLPIVIAVANRALSAPINIWNDQSDTIAERDSGWIQLYVESSQEAFDTIIQAYRIAEDKGVLLPVMVCLDGFTLSHVWEPVEISDSRKVESFVGRYKPIYAFLDPAKPMTQGPVAYPDTYMHFKKAQHEAMIDSIDIIKKINLEFKRKFGRVYGDGLIEQYRMDDADYALIGMGTLCSTGRVVVDKLRKEGIKAGLIKIRAYRPFPTESLMKAVKKLKGIAVIDRDISVGYEGALYSDVKSALCSSKSRMKSIEGFITGLGGKDITPENLENAMKMMIKAKGTKEGWLF